MSARCQAMRARSLGLLLTLAACDERSAAPTPSPEPNRTETATRGETRLRVGNGKNTADLRSGPEVPPTLLPGFTIYPGAKVTRNTVIERRGARQTLIEFETADPIAKVLLFHRSQAQAAGARLTLDLDGPDAASIGGRTASGGSFALTARQDAGRTAVQLSVESKPRAAAY